GAVHLDGTDPAHLFRRRLGTAFGLRRPRPRPLAAPAVRGELRSFVQADLARRDHGVRRALPRAAPPALDRSRHERPALGLVAAASRARAGRPGGRSLGVRLELDQPRKPDLVAAAIPATSGDILSPGLANLAAL